MKDVLFGIAYIITGAWLSITLLLIGKIIIDSILGG